MTAEPVDLAVMSDDELTAFSDYWMQQLEGEAVTLTQHLLRDTAYRTLREVRREAKRRALARKASA